MMRNLLILAAALLSTAASAGTVPRTGAVLVAPMTIVCDAKTDITEIVADFTEDAAKGVGRFKTLAAAKNDIGAPVCALGPVRGAKILSVFPLPDLLLSDGPYHSWVLEVDSGQPHSSHPSYFVFFAAKQDLSHTIRYSIEPSRPRFLDWLL
jgi:hypothetical protein